MAPMASSKIATTFNDFLVLPLRVAASQSFAKVAVHHLYLRANTPKLPTENTPRELFAVNVPVDATEKHFRSLFANQLGGVRVESVAFEGARVGKGINAPVAPVQQSKKRKREHGDEATAEEVGLLPEVWDRELHRSGGTAIVTFVDRASAELALKEVKRAVKGKATIDWVSDRGVAAALGSARYLTHHVMRYPDHAVLQESVDAFMTAYTALEEAKTAALAKLRSEPDEDGFITVTRGGRTGAGRQDEAKAKDEELKKREKNRIKEDFYRFQVREKKKEQAQDLVKGYQEDQRRVEEMKRRKGKFRPEYNILQTSHRQACRLWLCDDRPSGDERTFEDLDNRHLGTDHNRPPEQLNDIFIRSDDVHPMSTKSNIWGIGLCLWGLVRNDRRNPPGDRAMENANEDGFNEDHRKPEAFSDKARRDYSDDLLRLIMDCLEYLPTDRPTLGDVQRRVRLGIRAHGENLRDTNFDDDEAWDDFMPDVPTEKFIMTGVNDEGSDDDLGGPAGTIMIFPVRR